MNGPRPAGVTEIGRLIEQGMQSLGLAADAATLRRLSDFAALLEKWNRTYNLTAIRDTASIVSAHLLDSLAVAPYLAGSRGIDIGSGGGFPGIPLAIALPGCRLTLLDSSQKKSAFLRQAVAELELPNVAVVCARAESWQPAERYDWAVSRAFSDLVRFVQSAAHLVLPSGVLAAMKGVYPETEIAALPSSYKIREVVRLHVPGLDAERHLVLMERQ